MPPTTRLHDTYADCHSTRLFQVLGLTASRIRRRGRLTPAFASPLKLHCFYGGPIDSLRAVPRGVRDHRGFLNTGVAGVRGVYAARISVLNALDAKHGTTRDCIGMAWIFPSTGLLG